MPTELKLALFTKFLRSSKKPILLIVTSVVATVLVTTLIAIWLSEITDTKIPSVGTVKTLGIDAYWDESLENKTETIDWGTIWPGSSHNATLYLRSISNVEATLSLSTGNWNPVNLSEYISLSWNYDGTTLHPGEIIQVTLTLSASSAESFILYLNTNDVRHFSFDIIIRTLEHT